MVTRIAQEPLIHFLLLAVGIFLLQALFGSEDREVIVVDQTTREHLFQQAQDLKVEPLTEADRARVIDTFIEEEILVREARARGYNDSTRIRSLLIKNMRFLLSGEVDDPSEDELKAYFEKNPEKFVGPKTYSIVTVQFNDVSEVSDDVLPFLNNGGDPSGVGTRPVWYGTKVIDTTETEIVTAFGRETGSEILKLSPGLSWYGPFLMQDGGAAIIRLVAARDPQIPDFETIQEWVSNQWVTDTTRDKLRREIASISENYLIEITSDEDE